MASVKTASVKVKPSPRRKPRGGEGFCGSPRARLARMAGWIGEEYRKLEGPASPGLVSKQFHDGTPGKPVQYVVPASPCGGGWEQRQERQEQRRQLDEKVLQALAILEPLRT